MKAVMKVVRFDSEDIIATSGIAPRTKLSDYFQSNPPVDSVDYFASFLFQEAYEAKYVNEGSSVEDYSTWVYAQLDQNGQFLKIGFNDSYESDLYIWYDSDNWWTEGKRISEYGYDWNSTQWRTQ